MLVARVGSGTAASPLCALHQVTGCTDNTGHNRKATHDLSSTMAITTVHLL